MSVGVPMTKGQMDNVLTNLAAMLRNTHEQIRRVNTLVNGGAAGLAFMEQLGYDSAPNAANPSSMSDAAYALLILNYLWTNSGVYYGLVQQGGTGGTGAAEFDFDSGLAPVWGAQVLVTAASVLGFAGIVAAGLLALLGVLRSSRPPQHLADIEGLRALVQELRKDRDDMREQCEQLRVQLRECQRQYRELREGQWPR